MSPVEVVEILNTVTKMQADVIDDLFRVLMQHITVEEADALPVVAKINQIAQIRAEIDTSE